ncbi:hypothetical protein SDC9_153632 [bioreactor metagenome]|uniref:Uncharacterized protein n=1 Tax=bioreactor metagenome TaxID=1076179 RepID=A0A645EY77_9ZZZZ
MAVEGCRGQRDDPRRVDLALQARGDDDAVHPRHVEVHQDDIRVMGVHGTDHVTAVRHLGDHHEARIGPEDHPDSVTRHRVIVDQHHPDRPGAPCFCLCHANDPRRHL